MKVFQFVPEDPNTGRSGADLRNASLAASLAEACAFKQVLLDAGEQDANPRAKHALNTALKQVSAGDILLFEGSFYAAAMRIARQRFGNSVGIVCDFHNVEADLLKSNDLARLGPLAHAVCRARWRHAQALDARAISIADVILVCSHADGGRVRKLGAQNVSIVPNVAPDWCALVETEKASDARAGGKAHVVFVGHLGYPPNKRAVSFLVRRVLPVLKERLRDAQVTIAGRRPGARMRRMIERAGQRLLADPASMMSVYQAADCAVMPLTEGGGTRIKALEAFASGVPVVATRKAVEGLAVRDGQHVLVAHTATTFANAIIRLTEDRDLRAKIVGEARAYVLAHHGPSAVHGVLSPLIARLGEALPTQT
ncbi:MAG: glycosyltransferase family 4 protein [Pseudomonadota bacterium]